MSTGTAATREGAERAGARMRRVVARVEAGVDKVRWAAKRRLRWIDPVQIQAYRGWGTNARLSIQGRVLERRVIAPPAPEDRRLRNLARMWQRLRTDEVPRVRVRLRVGEAAAEAHTDDEGYFSLHLALTSPVTPETVWREVQLELGEELVRDQGAVQARGEVLIPGTAAEFAVVSDVDDTVLQTHVTDFLKMVRVTMLGNALTRLPFPGTTELFRALVAGRSGRAANPVFYLSRSPYNLYDLLVDFMDRHGLPRGPLLLRDWGIHAEASSDFKRERLTELLTTYPELPFVLVGDTGQHDPEVYLEIARAFPGRVLAIYIRDVGRHRKRTAVSQLVTEAAAQGVEMLLMSRADDALAHARARGLTA